MLLDAWEGRHRSLAKAVSWRVAKIPWVGVQTVKRSPASARARVE